MNARPFMAASDLAHTTTNPKLRFNDAFLGSHMRENSLPAEEEEEFESKTAGGLRALNLPAQTSSLARHSA
jgi:hypothetical protein